MSSRFRAPVHLLVVYEQGARRDGETVVEGVSRSTLGDLARKMTFVPAGHEYREWQEPRTLANLMYVYLDPAKVHQLDASTPRAKLSAKLFFEDATLLDTALKLKRLLKAQLRGTDPTLRPSESCSRMNSHAPTAVRRETNPSFAAALRPGNSARPPLISTRT